MAKKEKKHSLKITLPLIALCLPLFARHNVVAENGCPFETFVRVHGQCIDISEAGLDDVSANLDASNIEEVTEEIEELTEELAELTEGIEQLCGSESSETSAKLEIVEDMCE